MDIDGIVNSIGIALNIVGVIAVFYYSPVNKHTIDGGNLDTGYIDPNHMTNLRNRRLKIGVLIVVLGSITQLVSNFL